jgi:hypothetical protein
MTSGGTGNPGSESRTRLVIAGSAIIVVIMVVLGFAIYKVTAGKASPAAAASAAALKQVGPGSFQSPPIKITGASLTSGGLATTSRTSPTRPPPATPSCRH